MTSRKGWIVAAAVVFFVLLSSGGWLAEWLSPPKSFSVPRVEVRAELAPDGTMAVVERITYDFTGRFTYGTRPIPVGLYGITDVSVSERGEPLPFVGAPHNLQWSFVAEDEERTFDIAYTVRGAVVAGPDVAEVYWKWVGEDHPTIGEVDARLLVPPGPGELAAWGHGPLDGTVTVEADRVAWTATDVPRGTFVEGRVAVPRDRLPQLPVTSESRLPTILAEERAWAEAANASREAARRDAERREDARDLLTVVVPVLVIAGMVIFWVLWRRWGREPPRPEDVGEYLRDLPDDPPAVADALLDWGAVGPSAFAATVVDLAQRGYLTITQVHVDRLLLPDTVDHVLRRTDADYDALNDFERVALAHVFASGPEVRQSEMVKYGRSHQSETAARWKRFRELVSADLRGRRYINGGRAAPFVLNIACAAVIAIASVGALALRAWVPGVIGLAWAAAQLALTPLLRQRTPVGNRRYHEWRGVQRFLRDFSELEDAPVGHLVLWERYLVYAVALGVSAELARGLALRAPEVVGQSGFATWYTSDRDGPAFGSLASFGSSFGAAVVSASTPPSSGSGGGGGFSGGGGGGGGGGGIGAG